MRKFLLIFLTLIFSFGIAEEVLALNSPTNTAVVAVGEGSARVGWTWPPPTGPGSGTLSRFVLSYRVVGAVDWLKLYPSANGPEYTYMIMGLTENTTYEWTIMAEASDPAFNSSETTGPNFTTLAGGVPPPGNGDGRGRPPISLINPLKAKTFWEAIEALINILSLLAFAIAPILIIYAAFLIMTAGGKAEQVNKGKTIILWTLVALAIVLMAKGLPSVVKGILGG